MGAKEYVLPPIYSPKHQAFNRKTTAEGLITSLRVVLGEERLLKLSFLMVDGSTVNHVAREYSEGYLKRVHPVGDHGVANFEREIERQFPKITLLSCIGHMLNNVCKSSLKSYESKPSFLFKKSFSLAFWSGGKSSVIKGKYRGQVLEFWLAKFDEEVLEAEKSLKQGYWGLKETTPTRFKAVLEHKILLSPETLKNVAPQEAGSLVEKSTVPNIQWAAKDELLVQGAPMVLEAVNLAKSRKSVATPKAV